MDAAKYQLIIESKTNLCDDPSKEELEYIIPFLSEIMPEMARMMLIDEE